MLLWSTNVRGVLHFKNFQSLVKSGQNPEKLCIDSDGEFCKKSIMLFEKKTTEKWMGLNEKRNPLLKIDSLEIWKIDSVEAKLILIKMFTLMTYNKLLQNNRKTTEKWNGNMYNLTRALNKILVITKETKI